MPKKAASEAEPSSAPSVKRIKLDQARTMTSFNPVAKPGLRTPGKVQVKQLAIKNLKPAKSANNASNDNAVITNLARAIRAIVTSTPVPDSLQSLYASCEGLSFQSSQQSCYDRIKIELERRVGEIARGLRTGQEGVEWLAQVLDQWQVFSQQMYLVRDVLTALDRTYALSHSLLSFWDLGMSIFAHSVLSDETISNRITRSVLDLIQEERSTALISSRELVTSILAMLRSTDDETYSKVFAQPFIQSSRDYYELEGSNRLPVDGSDGSVAKYLTWVLQSLDAESERALVVIKSDDSTIRALLSDILIKQKVDTLLSSGWEPICDEEKMDTLSDLYRLLKAVDAVPELRKSFADYVKKRGMAIVTGPEPEMIDSLLNLQRKADKLVAESFDKSVSITRASRDAFATFINERKNKPAELMAKFIDAKMKVGNKAMSDTELEKLFGEVMALFRFTQGKDIFEAFYKKDFAKRLLLGRSASSDAERYMLIKLKEECGANFTAHLETMAKDIDLSNDIMTAYKDTSVAHEGPGLSVNVLTTGNWPTYLRTPLNLPSELNRQLEHFANFYLSKHNGRRLTWIHTLGHCYLKTDLSTKDSKGWKGELNVSLSQAIVLWQFADTEPDARMSYVELQERTGLEAKELERTLASLALAKHRLLHRHHSDAVSTKTVGIHTEDSFSLNYTFTSTSYRLKINQIQLKETVEEAQKTTDRVLLDRMSHLQLVIVRILKSRKTIKHTELMMEVVSSLKQRFRVETSEVKKAIDSLIERDYMEREGRDGYNYLA